MDTTTTITTERLSRVLTQYLTDSMIRQSTSYRNQIEEQVLPSSFGYVERAAPQKIDLNNNPNGNNHQNNGNNNHQNESLMRPLASSSGMDWNSL